MREIDDQKALSEYLGVPERTLERWRYERYGPPHVKVGRAVRYRRAAVDAWLKAQTISGWD